MEKWRRIFREGFLPQLSTRGLRCLRDALLSDDPLIVQGSTCQPSLGDDHRDEPIQATCVLGHAAWREGGLATVGQLEAFFMSLCDRVDERFSEPASCRFFLNWYDDTPRQEMRRQLLDEIRLALKERQPTAA